MQAWCLELSTDVQDTQQLSSIVSSEGEPPFSDDAQRQNKNTVPSIGLKHSQR